MATGNEAAFNMISGEAKKQGVPELVIDKLTTEILYIGNQSQIVWDRLYEYESEWNKTYGQSR